MAWFERGEEMVAGQLDPAVHVLHDVRASGVRCFALSNMEADRFALRRSAYPFFDLLDGWVISGIEGVAKPDPAIYQILLRRYGLNPAATVFVDDMEPNVAAARKAGVTAILYRDAGQLRRDLRGLGVALA
jgi:2-haloacid dehalogenase